MGPSQGNFWRSGWSGRPVQAQIDASSEPRRTLVVNHALWNTGHSSSRSPLAVRSAARRGFG